MRNALDEECSNSSLAPLNQDNSVRDTGRKRLCITVLSYNVPIWSGFSELFRLNPVFRL